MKDKDYKNLIGKSKVETSDDFLNNLMHQIEEQSLSKTNRVLSFSHWKLIAICSVLISIISLSGYTLLNNINVSVNCLGVSKISIFIVGLGIMLVVLNNFIRTMELSSDLGQS